MTLAPSRDLGPRMAIPSIQEELEFVEYELQPVCAVPGCPFPPEMGSHHIERRSSTRVGGVKFVIIDGLVIPNRVRLCVGHHAAVTGLVGGHAARIVWHDDPVGHWCFRVLRPNVVVLEGPLVGIEGMEGITCEFSER